MVRVPPSLGIDSKASSILVDGEERRVTPRAMAVLLRLLEAGGSVVSKDELVADVWEGAAVSDDVISTAIYELRRALGDDARAPRCIQTLRKSGYRWLGALPSMVTAPEPRPAEPPAPAPPARWARVASLQRGPLLARAWRWTAGGLLGVLAAFVAAAWIGGREPAPTAAVPARACELYQRAMHLALRGDPADSRRAIAHLERALELDPSFAPAHLGLAEVYLELASRQSGPVPSGHYRRARAALDRAAAAGAEPSDVLAVRATLDLRWDADLRRAEADLRRAREQSSCGRGAYDARLAELLSARGRHEEALAMLAGAVGHEVASARAHWLEARLLYHARRYREARAELEAALELEPYDRPSLRLLAAVDTLLGEPASAADAYLREARLTGLSATELGALEKALAEDGLDGVLRWRLESRRSVTPLGPLERSAALVQLGDHESALAELARAFAERRPDLVWLRVDPAFEPLREEPAFRELLSRLDRVPSPRTPIAAATTRS
jgi:DNA-binding winged helix-turn-helix (wHTH) protein/Tfp pilus assembly protein PilF